MSKLDRMNLMGIRSFGPDEADVQKIKFITPLTLIQGQNGCGKTTIIEAIKFAITGELPGGSTRGQGFVYDPKLSKAFESIGRIKLRLIDTKGDLVTVMKVVRVLQKGPDKLEFKRLDSTISRTDSDDPNHVSNRCADVDQEMCLVLGVCKPIINLVLFCHQEDSNWPLEESKKLKERFDEIFDATKYNKCLDHIHKQIKTKSQRIELIRVEVDGLLDKKKNVENKKESLQEKEDKFDDVSETILKVISEIQPINKKINELYKLEQGFAKLHTSIELKKKDLEHVQQQQQDILKNTKEFIGTDDELKLKLLTFEEDLNSLDSDISVLTKKKQQIEDDEKKLLKNINDRQMNFGELQSQSKENNKKLNNRNILINNTVKEFHLQNIDTVTNDTSNLEINEVLNKLKTHFNIKKNEINSQQIQMENEEDTLQNDIDKVRDENAKLNQNVNSKITQLHELKEEYRSIKHKLEELNTADNQLQLAESKLQHIEREIKSLETSVNTEALRTQIFIEKNHLKTFQERCIIVENEIKKLQQYTNIQTELYVKKENYLNKENQLNKLKNKHEKSLVHIFSDEIIPDEDLKGDLERYYKKQCKNIKELTININDKQKEVLKLENNLNNYQEKLTEKEMELKRNQEKIEKYCDKENLPDILIKCNEKLDRLQNERGVYYSSKYLYKKFIKQFQEDNPSCPLCKRHIEEKTLTRSIIEELKKKIESFPNELQRIDKELNQEQKTQKHLLSLQPINETVEKIKNDEIPILKKQIEHTNEKVKNSTIELKKLKFKISELESNEQISNSIMGDVSLIDQYHKDMNMLQREISELQKRMPNSSNNEFTSRGLEEAMSERETLNIDIRSVQNNIESTQSKLTQHTERLQKLKEQKNELIYQQLNIKTNLKDKDHLVTKSVEIQNKIIQLNTEINSLRSDIDPLKNKLDSIIKKKDEFKVLHRNKREQFRLEIDDIQKKINETNNLQKVIEEFQEKKIHEKIETIQNDIKQFKSELEQYTNKKNQIDKSIEELKCQGTNSRMYLRELEDNIQLREKRKQAKNLEEEIKIEENNLGKNDINQIRCEKSSLIDEYESLRQKQHTCEGKKTTLLDDIQVLKKELALPENAKIAQDHRRKQMEYLLQKCALDDLKTFENAMIWSLMQYHKKRMVQVNNTIKELWRTIYKGNDIDYIEIKTDDIKTQGQDKRKVYSYRVVQVKNEVELEMRGRCSAGQRVLASLIIRIALAETFSANCGILALDEPTTNLDRENINSLADALIELLQQRRQQKNFQLLIITHDQDFVDRLTQMESLDSYYEIKRNAAGKSIITVHNRY